MRYALCAVRFSKYVKGSEMARFYVARPQVEDGILKIEGDEVRHIRKVLRLGRGDEMHVFDASGNEYEGTITEEGSFSVSVRIRNIFPSQKESGLDITLAQSLLKGEKMDYLVQKAIELGIKRIVPFISTRSIPLLEGAKRIQRHKRWERIAIGASKQCGRGGLARIDPPGSFPDMLESATKDSLRLVLWEKEGERLKEVLGKKEKKEEVFFIVGPEGGLSQEEVGEAEKAHFIPVTLGKRILRSETASLCLLSILQYEWGDMG
jgi:16S rRNA (uracil1498-N3)-methyltransferase